MAKDIPISDWAQQWFSRTLPALHCETILVVYFLASISLFTGIRALLRVRRSRQDLASNPSDRAAILSQCDKQLHKSTRTIFYISIIYLLHSLAIWVGDAAIGLSYMFQDVTSNPEDYDAIVWFDLAFQCVSMLALFTAVFLIFPMLQILGVAHLIKKALPKNGDGTLSAYISEGRIVSTHLAQLWMMLGFFVVSWWPVEEYTFARLMILEAVFGSGLTWLNASFVFNFRTEVLCKVRFQPVRSVGDVKQSGRQVMAVYTEKSELLPKYEEPVQT